MSLKALIFDFDGTILDTEFPEFEGWQKVYKSYGVVLNFEEWGKCIGTSQDAFDPFLHLEKLTNRKLDRETIRQQRLEISKGKLLTQEPLPGIVSMLDSAKKKYLHIGIASSSPISWVKPHIKRLGIAHYFETFTTADDVDYVKPDPTLFQLAAARLNIQPEEAIAFEDSPPGITAAKEAGMFCVVIPNKLTKMLDTSQADIQLNSLADIDLETLIKRFDENGTN